MFLQSGRLGKVLLSMAWRRLFLYEDLACISNYRKILREPT